MLCPKCAGTAGKVAYSDDGVGFVVGCDYPGCIAGVVSCCDPVIEQPEPDPNQPPERNR